MERSRILATEFDTAFERKVIDAIERDGTPANPEFFSRMRDAMCVSFHKYGPIQNGYPHRVVAIDSIDARIDKYRSTKNTEFLIDVANFFMIEFIRPSVP